MTSSTTHDIRIEGPCPTCRISGDRLLTPIDLQQRWGLRSVGHLANLRSAGRGPIFVRLGPGAGAPVRYRLADVLNYEEALTVYPVAA